MDEIVLRPAVYEDMNSLLEFEQGVIAAERPFEPTLKAGAVNYYDIDEMIRSENIKLVVALIDQELIGCGYALKEKGKPFQKFEHFAYIGFMFVKPQHRGKGVSKKILQDLTQWAKSENINEIRLDVYGDNMAAVRAYEKAGFSKHLVHMRLDLEED